MPDGVGAQAIVGTGTTTPVAITLDTAQTVGSLTFTNTSSSTTGYTLNPGVNGSLVMQNTGGTGSQIAVTSGVHAIAAPMEISGGSLYRAQSTGGSLGADWRQRLGQRRHGILDAHR